MWISSIAAAVGSSLLGVVAERARRRERQHRPDALSARQQRVAHRLVEHRRRRLVGEAKRREVILDQRSQVVRDSRRRLGELAERPPARSEELLLARDGVLAGAPRASRSSSAAASEASSAHSPASRVASSRVELAVAKPRRRLLEPLRDLGRADASRLLSHACTRLSMPPRMPFTNAGASAPQ